MSVYWTQISFQILPLLLFLRGINAKDELGSAPPPLVSAHPLSTDVKSVVIKGGGQVEKVEVLNPVHLVLECNLTGARSKPPNITGHWTKDGNEIENSRLTVQLENEQFNLKRAFGIIGEESLGNYSCVFGDEANVDFILAVPQMGEMRDKPIVGYMGDSVVILCKIEETKPKPNTWRWFRTNGTDKEAIDTAAEPHRYKIRNDDRKTILTLQNVTEADSGPYYCTAVYSVGTSMGRVEVKIISFLEPLKPFIGIVVEVLVLVVIILLYERNTKNKSDGGNEMTAEQTNKLTQGDNNGMEVDSSVRQRKV
ncbi:embigin [Lampris incognitus]|uniref:embigin n=1 Tax=Lampris incognitus TaxID=2546036 RepID=UPI0024B48EDA|nr:embigin [Lampris incognitus]